MLTYADVCCMLQLGLEALGALATHTCSNASALAHTAAHDALLQLLCARVQHGDAVGKALLRPY